MALAQAYGQGQANPFDGVLEAYGMGQQLRQNRDLLQANQAEQARKIQAQQVLDTLDWNDKNAIAQTVAQFPEYTKGAKDYYDSLEQKEQQSLILDMSKSISALGSNRPDVAVQLMRDQAAAYEDMGMPEKAAERSQMAEWMATDPLSARRALMMQYAVLSPEKSGSNLESYGKALNPQSKEVDAGNAIYNYSVTPDGEVGGAEWIVDKAATPDNVLDNQTSITNNELDNKTSRDNNYDTNTVSRQNNITTNQTSRDNNTDNNVTSRYNADLTAELKKYGIDVNKDNAANILEYRRQKDEVDSKKGTYKTFGGKVYVTYPDGTATPALDAQGNQMTDTKVDSTSKKAIAEYQGDIDKNNQLIGTLRKAKQLSKAGIYEGFGAEGRANTVGAIPFVKGTETSKRTQEFINLVQNNALSSMKAIFGGNPTEGERAILMKLQASAQYPADVREAILDEAIAAANARITSTKGQMSIVQGSKSSGGANDAKRSSLFK